MRKFSKQREIVLDILKKSYSHPTANEVFQEARLIDQNISLGTVYRNLELLCKDKIIEKISTPLNIDRYDFKKSQHSHAICECCGKIFDFTLDENLESIKSKVEKQAQIKINHDEIRIIGICKKCQTNIGEENENK